MRELYDVFRDPRGLIHILLAGMLFFLLAAPFRALLNLIPGLTEVRPANMLPVVLGLLWGPAGAWGTTIANACSDILVSRSPASIWLPGFFINFFYSYLPYKMWYSMRGGEKDILPPSLENVRQIIKYIYICLLDSLVVTVFLGVLCERLGIQSFSSSVLLLFFNNFDFAIVLGVPAILILTNMKLVSIWTPRDVDVWPGWPLGRFSEPLLWLVPAAGAVYYVAEKCGAGPVPEHMASACMAAIGAVLFLCFARPVFPCRAEAETGCLSGISIRAKVIIGFLILSVTFVLMIGASAYVSLRSIMLNRFEIWQYIYIIVGVSLNIIFLVSLVFLKYVENNITGPLERLTGTVQNFTGRDHGDVVGGRRFMESCEWIHTGDEIEKLSDSFRVMMKDITDYVENLEKMTREKERIGAELNVATQIQMDMLPRIFPPFPGRREIDIYASMHAAKEVGGDFYDFFLVDERHLAVVIADVSGKGVPAALFMVIAKTLIKNQAQLGGDPESVFTVVNNQLCEGNEAGLFVTAWLGILDLHSGELTYVNAGHNPPLLLTGGAKPVFLKAPGFVLAGAEDISYTQTKVTLMPGDRLFLYTDGVTEAENGDRVLYGDGRLKTVISAMRSASAREMVAGVHASIAEFVGDAKQFDDITMIALVYYGRADGNP